MGVASAIGPVARKPFIGDFVAGSLFIHNSQPFLKLSSGRKTWQTSATTKAHAHGTLLTDIARTLQTAVTCEVRGGAVCMCNWLVSACCQLNMATSYQLAMVSTRSLSNGISQDNYRTGDRKDPGYKDVKKDALQELSEPPPYPFSFLHRDDATLGDQSSKT